MMTKNDIRTFDDLVKFAKFRAKNSLKRNDPWAMAYWKATQVFAETGREVAPVLDWIHVAKLSAKLSREFYEAGDTIQAALWYSRAKWYVIMGRNNGVVMNPRITGVNKKVFQNGRSA